MFSVKPNSSYVPPVVAGGSVIAANSSAQPAQVAPQATAPAQAPASPTPSGNNGPAIPSSGSVNADVSAVLNSSSSPARASSVASVSPDTKQSLISELVSSGVKCTPENILAIARVDSEKVGAKIAFMEEGNQRSGFNHVHFEEFNALNIPKQEIPGIIVDALANGKKSNYGIGTNKDIAETRPIYSTTYNDKPLNIGITVADNGYIVGAQVVTDEMATNGSCSKIKASGLADYVHL